MFHNNGQWGTEARMRHPSLLFFFKLFSKIGKGVPGLSRKVREWPLKETGLPNTGKVREYVVYNFNCSCNICEYE